MINIVIVEDEIPAAKSLIERLSQTSVKTNVLKVITSVSGAKEYFAANKTGIDLVFLDIQLGGENSLTLLKENVFNAPVVIVTAYDVFILEALQYTSIDYILKPISADKIEKVLAKYFQLKEYFASSPQSLSGYLNNVSKKNIKTRVLVKKGGFYQYVRVEDIAYIYTDQKIVFLTDLNNVKYITQVKNLSVFEDELDDKMFFRANRKFIINIGYIKKFKPIDKVKIALELNISVNEEIIISQETAPKFKAWINEEL